MKPETVDGEPTFFAVSIEDWRNWLEENGRQQRSIWLIVFNKTSKKESAHFHDVIEHALCYGWVDSKARKRDPESCYLRFTPRNPASNWGKRNQERAKKMIELGLMRPAGQALIDQAVSSGKWNS